MKKTYLILALVAVGLLTTILIRGCVGKKNKGTLMNVPPSPVLATPTLSPSPSKSSPVAIPQGTPKLQLLSAKPVASKKTAEPAMVDLAPPTVELHQELIPKNIQIVRVYYESDLMSPGAKNEFDINGSGFTKEFQKMITVVSGNPSVSVTDLTYVTLNQIHGRLISLSTASTSVGFPQVLIDGKVVFRAPEPFAVIRPGEVLTVVFTDMGESGRSGRFRVYTNLTEDMFGRLSIAASTPAIQVSEISPHLPYIVDATLNIGPALVGDYGLTVSLDGKKLWYRDGVVRVLQPAAEEAGLIQRLKPVDLFFRPGDKARFQVQGSGFQPKDAEKLQVAIEGFSMVISSWVFVAPGRMDLSVHVPENAEPRTYPVRIFQGEKTLFQQDGLIEVVPPNWIREFQLSPVLKPGATCKLVLVGRDLEKKFIESLKGGFDEQGLSLKSFVWIDATKAEANLSASPQVAAGDYLLNLERDGKEIMARFGNVIKVVAPAP